MALKKAKKAKSRRSRASARAIEAKRKKLLAQIRALQAKARRLKKKKPAKKKPVKKKPVKKKPAKKKPAKKKPAKKKPAKKKPVKKKPVKKKPAKKKAPPKKRKAPPKKRKAPPKKRKAPPKKRKAPPKKPRVDLGPKRPWVRYYSFDDVRLSSRYIYASHFNLETPSLEQLEQISKSFIANVARKGGGLPTDLTIVTHGLVLRPFGESFRGTDTIKHLNDELVGLVPDSTILQVIDEGPSQDTLRIVFDLGPLGDTKSARAQMDMIHEVLVIALDVMRMLFDEVAWEYFFETDSEIYERRA